MFQRLQIENVRKCGLEYGKSKTRLKVKHFELHMTRKLVVLYSLSTVCSSSQIVLSTG